MNTRNFFLTLYHILLTTAVLLIICPNVSKGQSKTDVLTQHNDNYRTGANLQETILTPDKVNKKNFGKLFDLEVDGQIYTQPLVVSGVVINGQAHDVVLVGTQHNSIFVFDTNNGKTIWRKNFGEPIPTPNSSWSHPWGYYTDLTPEVGIVSTPVIDKTTNTVYFTNPTWNGKTLDSLIWWFHAVDLRDGSEKFGGPVEVSGSVGVIYHEGGREAAGAPPISVFRPDRHMQRTGLLLDHGRVVLGFASHGDQPPYQGWLFSYNAADLKQTAVWSSIGGGAMTQLHYSAAGVWQSGMGPATDDEGNIYIITGNGVFDEPYNSFGDSFIKLRSGSLEMVDFFTPCNQDCLRKYDIDLGNSGVLLLPGTELMISGGKQARLYLINRNNLGKFDTSLRSQWLCELVDPEQKDFECRNPNVVQEFQARHGELKTPHELIHIHGAPVYWKSDKRGDLIYVWTEDAHLRAFEFDRDKGENPPGRFINTGSGEAPPWAKGKEKSPAYLHRGMTGGMLSVSSNQGTNGIVWATTPTNNNANPLIVPGILRAYDADDLTNEVWNSYEERDRDDFGNYAKFTPSTIANGKVYVATFSNHLSVYGLNPPRQPLAPDNLIQNGDFEEGQINWTATTASLFTVDSLYPYYHNMGGRLLPKNIGEGKLYQVVKAPKTGFYELSAYCANSLLEQVVVPTSQYQNVTLGVDIDGRQFETTAQVLPFSGYLKYSFYFNAKKGSEIKVWYYVPGVQPILNYKTFPANQPAPYAVIDHVMLVKK